MPPCRPITAQQVASFQGDDTPLQSPVQSRISEQTEPERSVRGTSDLSPTSPLLHAAAPQRLSRLVDTPVYTMYTVYTGRFLREALSTEVRRRQLSEKKGKSERQRFRPLSLCVGVWFYLTVTS